uniref:Uncharacterized protein n=1 Tax=Cucumis melo TaxID=3656 RepID=A0A9I9E3Z2_CUCME
GWSQISPGGSAGRRQDRLGLSRRGSARYRKLRGRLGLQQGGDAARLRGTRGAASHA